MVLNSTFGQNNKFIISIVLGVMLILFLKYIYGIITATYSKKTRLLNYLYSPYLFVWKRDWFSEFSDYEIAAAILKVCDIKDDSLLEKNLELENFLINLQKKVRPPYEHKKYPQILKESKKQANRIYRKN